MSVSPRGERRWGPNGGAPLWYFGMSVLRLRMFRRFDRGRCAGHGLSASSPVAEANSASSLVQALLALLTCTLFCSGLAVAAPDPPPAAFLRTLERHLSRPSQPSAPDAWPAAECAIVLQDGFDIPLVSRTAAGPLWDGMAPSERIALWETIINRGKTVCMRELRQRGAPEIEVLRVRQTAQGASLTSRMRYADGTETIATWRLVQGGPWGWRAEDLTLDGNSLVGLLRSEFTSLANGLGGDIAAAIRALGGGTPTR